MPNDERGPYILWTDYGPYGWKPESFDSPEKTIKAIIEGYTFGNPFVITSRLELSIQEPKPNKGEQDATAKADNPSGL